MSRCRGLRPRLQPPGPPVSYHARVKDIRPFAEPSRSKKLRKVFQSVPSDVSRIDRADSPASRWREGAHRLELSLRDEGWSWSAPYALPDDSPREGPKTGALRASRNLSVARQICRDAGAPCKLAGSTVPIHC